MTKDFLIFPLSFETSSDCDYIPAETFKLIHPAFKYATW